MSGSCDCHADRNSYGPCGENGDYHHSHRLFSRHRSGESRYRGKPSPPRRQCHRCQLHGCRTERQKVESTTRADATRHADRAPCQSRKSGSRGDCPQGHRGGGRNDWLAHPGGNITGFTVDDSALGGKWVELLKQIAPATIRVALLFNPAGPPLEFFLPSIQAAASSLNVQANLVTIHGRDEIEAVIAAQARDPGGGIIALANAFNTTNRELIIELAARYRVPAIYFSAYCAQSGGLIGYGSDYAEQSRQAAGYIDRILKGTKPADLPVQAPTKYELVINLKTAKALGLEIPDKLLAIADEVIE